MIVYCVIRLDVHGKSVWEVFDNEQDAKAHCRTLNSEYHNSPYFVQKAEMHYRGPAELKGLPLEISRSH